MIYILTIKKHYAQKGAHPSLVAVRQYINMFGKTDLLICWPGYLSTTVNTANLFHRGFPLNLPRGVSVQNNCCYFFKGINGYNNIKGATPPTSIYSFVNNLYNNYSSSYCLNDDHSKIIAFCDTTIINPPYNGLSLDGFIKSIINKTVKIKAFLIGSSNHSHSTLTKISPDKKGECDILMIDANYLSDDDVKRLYWSIIENQNKLKHSDNHHYFYTLSKEIESNTDLNDIFVELLDQ